MGMNATEQVTWVAWVAYVYGLGMQLMQLIYNYAKTTTMQL